MRLLSSIRIVRVSLALAVAFWMAGAGCMLGCDNMVAAASSPEVATPADSPTIVATGEACASMQSHDCCAKRGRHSVSKPTAKVAAKTKSELVAESHRHIPAEANNKLDSRGPWNTETTSSFAPALNATPVTMIDCPLAVNATAVLSKVGSDDSHVALPSSAEPATLVNPLEQTSAIARPLRLPNRGHTYLRCCVFLI
jgi:hypothetical protein